jgi:cytidine deaminase
MKLVKESRVFYVPYKYSIHAEKEAIMNIPKKYKHVLKECKIYIIRIKNGEMQSAIPCENCIKLFNKFNLTKIYTL